MPAGPMALTLPRDQIGGMMPKLSVPLPRAFGALSLAAAIFAAAPGPARADDQAAAASGRPRIGLVLAGGGAKGGAHVGVLKVLEEMRVPIDCIAGTSMGALVGGGYASGIPAKDLETFVTTIDWKKVVGSQGRRDLEPIEQKRDGATYSNDFELGITPDGILLPGGLVNTSNIEDLLRSYVATARLTDQFDKLPIPYRAVATDMVTGSMVVLDKGDLATAMRASMAIPGAFAPVLMDDKILNDGGLVRNIPIDVARDLCADHVIVVNLVELPIDPKRLRTATQLLSRTMDVMIEANETLQLQTIREGDIRIDVHMGDITTADFERVPDTVPLGEAAAREHAAALAKYAVPAEQYAAWRAKVTRSQDLEVRLAEVRYEGLERVNPQYLAGRDNIKAGDKVDSTALSTEAQRMAVLRDFDSVGYRLDGDPEASILTWLPREKNWGPNYLKADLGLYTSSDGDLEFALYGRHVRTWVNSLGAEWRNEVLFGGETLLSTSFFQPVDQAHRFFVEPRAGVCADLREYFPRRRTRGPLPVPGCLRPAGCWRELRSIRPGARGLPVRSAQNRSRRGFAPAGGVEPDRCGHRGQRRIRQPRHRICAVARVRRRARIPQLRRFARRRPRLAARRAGRRHCRPVAPEYLVDHDGGRFRSDRRSAARSGVHAGRSSKLPGLRARRDAGWRLLDGRHAVISGTSRTS